MGIIKCTRYGDFKVVIPKRKSIADKVVEPEDNEPDDSTDLGLVDIKFLCIICHELIPNGRVKALKIMEVPEFSYKCLKCAKEFDKHAKAFYAGLSPLQVARKIEQEKYTAEEIDYNHSCLKGEEFGNSN